MQDGSGLLYIPEDSHKCLDFLRESDQRVYMEINRGDFERRLPKYSKVQKKVLRNFVEKSLELHPSMVASFLPKCTGNEQCQMLWTEIKIIDGLETD